MASAVTPSRPNPTGDRSWLGALGVLLVTAALGLAVGPAGLLVAATLAVAWYLSPAPYGFALAVLALVAFVPAALSMRAFSPDAQSSVDVDTATAGLAVVGPLCLLLAPSGAIEGPVWTAATTGALAVGLGAIAWVGRRSTDALWPGAVVLLGTGALAAYGLHRYELLRVGLLDPS
jgi:hypothetical protein